MNAVARQVAVPADDDRLAYAEAALGYAFNDRALVREALTHRSYINEHAGQGLRSNERMEFLGDALLGFLVAEVLHSRFAGAQEGELTAWRVALIRTGTLARWARHLDLGPALFLSRGESDPGALSDRLLANTFEAVLAAIYLDGGLDSARQFLARCLANADEIIARLAPENYKGRLQELAQDPAVQLPDMLGLGGSRTPLYAVVERHERDGSCTFTVEVRIDGRAIGVGSGPNKRLAEQAAARDALQHLGAGVEPN